jgi:peptide/nickel transport system permease protein
VAAVSTRWFLVRRAAFAVLAVYLVVSTAFAFVALTPDPNISEIEYAVASTTRLAENVDENVEAAVSAYEEARNLDDPVHERYLRWLLDVTLLDWGQSYASGAPVTSLLGAHLPFTLAYVLPAMLVSTLGGVALGVYSAVREPRLLDRLGTGSSYLALGIPNFWLAGVAVAVAEYGHGWILTDIQPELGVLHPANLVRLAVPAAILATSLLAGQLRYVRSETREHAAAEFARLLEAKGAGPRTIARHALKNAAPPLVSLFFVDLLAVLVLNVYVLEYVFEIPGFGILSYNAIINRDVPVILGTTMVVAFVGIGGNLLQDLAYAVFDPRVGDEE